MWQTQVRLNEPLVRQVKLMDKIINEQAKYISTLENEGSQNKRGSMSFLKREAVRQ